MINIFKCEECNKKYTRKDSLKKHLKKHGMTLDDHDKKHGELYTKKNEFNEATLVYEFLKRKEQGKGINYTEMKNDDKLLIHRIEKKFGNINKLCDFIGINEDERKKFNIGSNGTLMSKKEIEEKLTELKFSNQLTTHAIRTYFGDTRLENAIKRYYGTVRKCLDHYSLETDVTHWTKELVLEKIRKYYDEDLDLSYSFMINHDSALVAAAQAQFDLGWNEVLRTNQIEFISGRRKFSKEYLLEQGFNILEEFGDINYSIVKQFDQSISLGIGEYFGGFENFLLAMGLNPEEHMDTDSTRAYGFQFEKVFKEILDALQVDYEYNKYLFDEQQNYLYFENQKLRPDFQLDENIIIDCKLSSWTPFLNQNDIKKYLLYCDKLIFVYLRGTEKFENPFEKVELICIDTYYNKLRDIDRLDLIEKIENIKSQLESVTTERSNSKYS